MVTNALVSPVVPPVALPHRDQHQPPAGPQPASGRRTLPLPDVPAPRTNATVYGMATLDARGRVADQAILRALGWAPGLRLEIRETHGLLVIRTDTHGVFRVTSQGHLRLPAPVRHCCGVATADRVLLAAHPRHQQLVIYPPAALDTMIAQRHADLAGGDVV